MKTTVFVRVVLLTALMFLSISAAPVSASNVGVSAGMWWKYGQISSSGPPYGNVSWVKNTIQSVNGFIVTMLETLHYNNGTENNQSLSGNIATGDGDLQMFIILGGLHKNDPVYQGGSSGWINDTITRTYLIGKRSINYQNVTAPPGSGYTQTTLSYWDQVTGILLEDFYNSSIGLGLQYSLKVTEASPSTFVPTFPGVPLLLGIVVITTSVYFTLKRKVAYSPTHHAEAMTNFSSRSTTYVETVMQDSELVDW